MAEQHGEDFEQPTSFSFDAESETHIARHLAKYPADKKASAVLPLLDIVQRQMKRQTDSAWVPLATPPEETTCRPPDRVVSRAVPRTEREPDSPTTAPLTVSPACTERMPPPSGGMSSTGGSQSIVPPLPSQALATWKLAPV